jgi:lipopolysaccharide export LptBFGC system permease protein LptF
VKELGHLRLWIPIAIAATAVVVCVFYYFVLDVLEEQGASGFSIVNAVGLVVVIFGLIAAGIMLRRTSPP